MTDVRRVVPPFLYLPCRAADGGESFDPELREVDAGQGLVAYTALDRLHRAWGADQTWVVLPVNKLIELRDRVGFVALLLDDGLREEERALD